MCILIRSRAKIVPILLYYSVYIYILHILMCIMNIYILYTIYFCFLIRPTPLNTLFRWEIGAKGPMLIKCNAQRSRGMLMSAFLTSRRTIFLASHYK